MQFFEFVRKSTLAKMGVGVPVGILFAFVFFNLVAVPDTTKVMGDMSVAIVNLDAGIPGGNMKLGTLLATGLGSQLPLKTASFADRTQALDALDRGDVVGVLVIPPDFSKAVATGATVNAEFTSARHLSLAATQAGATLAQNVSAGIQAGVEKMRAMLAQQTAAAKSKPGATSPSTQAPGAIPATSAKVAVNTVLIHESKGSVNEAAPRILGFPLWLASMMSALFFFIALRGKEQQVGIVATTVFPPLAQVVGTGLGTLLAVLSLGLVAGLPSAWGELWLFLWVGAIGIAWMIWPLLRMFGFASLVVLFPLVFLQQMVGGVMAPAASAPAWISWISNLIPAESITKGITHYVLGGPSSVDWGRLFVQILCDVGLVAVALGVKVLVSRRKHAA